MELRSRLWSFIVLVQSVLDWIAVCRLRYHFSFLSTVITPDEIWIRLWVFRIAMMGIFQSTARPQKLEDMLRHNFSVDVGKLRGTKS